MSTIVGLTPVWQQAQFFDDTGYPLTNGQVWTYANNVDETVPSWTDKTGTVHNTNPIILDSSGRMQTEIWLRAGDFYCLVLCGPGEPNGEGGYYPGHEYARVHDVSVQQLLAGTNITLDPPSGVGPTVTINAAGSVGNPKGRGQSYLFYANDTSNTLAFNNTPYSGMTFTALTTPYNGGTADVSISGGLITFNTSGVYEIDITTTLTSLVNWPANNSIFGVTVTNALTNVNKSYHTRYSNGSGDSLGSSYQKVSFTDTFMINGNANSTFSVYADNATSPAQKLNVAMQIVATRIAGFTD